jgi:hypothetical protein
MASRLAVLKSLKMLSLAFSGDVTEERVDLYAAALNNVPDDKLATATVRLIATHKGEWIPVPAMIRDAAGANAIPRIDVDATIRLIDRLGDYNPNTGWRSPSVETVRDAMGDGAADAYGAVGGGSRLLDATDPLTREIAARDLAKELEAVRDERGPDCLPQEIILPVLRPNATPRLPSPATP